MAKPARILLVGAGQLGSRHLQGLCKIEYPSEITVVDPSAASLALARARAEEVKEHQAEQSINYMDALPMSGSFNVAIVATSATGRRRLVTDLVSGLEIENLILEKVVFQHPDDFDPVGRLLTERSARTFVNCPRRLNVFYKKLRGDLLKNRPITMHVVGQGWGLACNAVHFLDLFAYLSGSPASHVDNRGLLGGSRPAKRRGYRELYGTIGAHNEIGSTLTMTCLGDAYQGVTVCVADGVSETLIHETRGRIESRDGNGDRGEDFRLEFQSELTGSLVSELLSSGNCSLTPYAESAEIHKPFLSAVLKHLNANQESEVNCCPIT